MKKKDSKNKDSKKEEKVPISDKAYLTVTEAAKYTNLGVNKLAEISNDAQCTCVLRVGKKRLFNREGLVEYLSTQYSI